MRSEGESNRQDRIVIAGVKAGGRDLVPAAHSEAESLPQVKPSHHQARCYEVLFLAVVLAVLEKRRVELELRPELAKDVVLKGIVPGASAANQISIRNRQANSKRALRVEVAEPFAICDRRRNDSVQSAVCI